MRTPFCGKGDCVWPDSKPDGSRADPGDGIEQYVSDLLIDGIIEHGFREQSVVTHADALEFLKAIRAAREEARRLRACLADIATTRGSTASKRSIRARARKAINGSNPVDGLKHALRIAREQANLAADLHAALLASCKGDRGLDAFKMRWHTLARWTELQKRTKQRETEPASASDENT